MSSPDARVGGAVERATALAREIAPDVGSMLLTHYPDADTLDTLRPGADDLGTVAAVSRAVAAELAGLGVRVFVQVANRATFRAWMRDRADTRENRLAWRDRGNLLSGAAALAVLGLDTEAPRPRTGRGGRTAGSPADRLVRAFADGDGAQFDALADELLSAGRDGVLDVALRKAAERHGEEAVGDFAADLLAAAEGAEIGPSGWAELVALPVALPAGGPPPAAGLARGAVGSGAFPDTAEVRFLPEWRVPAALADLSPCAVRRVLVDLVEGREPADLPPAGGRQVGGDALAGEDFGVLLGVRIDWDIPMWEAVEADGGLTAEPEGEEEAPDEAARREAFDLWRSNAFRENDGCVPLALVPPSEVEAEIADFLEEAGAHTGGLEEIREFVAVARGEAAGEEVVCRPEVVGDGLELTLYTREGRFLDSLTLAADQLPAGAEEMPRLIEAFVPLVKDTPGW